MSRFARLLITAAVCVAVLALSKRGYIDLPPDAVALLSGYLLVAVAGLSGAQLLAAARALPATNPLDAQPMTAGRTAREIERETLLETIRRG